MPYAKKPSYTRKSATMVAPRRGSGRTGYTARPSAARPAMQRAVTKEISAVKDEMMALDKILAQSGMVDLDADAVGGGLKPVVVCKQRYFERVVLGDAASIPAVYTFRLNSTFDPNETGTGHQPFGRDTMASSYNDYVVIGATWEVQLKNISEGSHLNVWAYASTDALPAVDSYQKAKESSPTLVKSIQLRAYTEEIKGEWGVLRGAIDPKDFMLPKLDFDEQFTAGIGSNPSTAVRLHICAEDTVGGALSTGSLAADVIIVYDVAYKTPRLAQYS